MSKLKQWTTTTQDIGSNCDLFCCFSGKNESRAVHFRRFMSKLGYAKRTSYKPIDYFFRGVKDSKTGKVHFVDVFQVLNDRYLGRMNANNFFFIAENSVRINELNIVTLNELPNYNTVMRENFYIPATVMYSLMFTTRFLENDKDFDILLTALRDNGFKRNSLVLNFDCASLCNLDDDSVLRVARLKKAGYKISGFGFGEDFNSLDIFARIKLDYIRLEARYFDADPNKKILLKTLNYLSKQNKVKLVVDGADISSQTARFKREGIKFYTGKAVSPLSHYVTNEFLGISELSDKQKVEYDKKMKKILSDIANDDIKQLEDLQVFKVDADRKAFEKGKIKQGTKRPVLSKSPYQLRLEQQKKASEKQKLALEEKKAKQDELKRRVMQEIKDSELDEKVKAQILSNQRISDSVFNVFDENNAIGSSKSLFDVKKLVVKATIDEKERVKKELIEADIRKRALQERFLARKAEFEREKRDKYLRAKQLADLYYKKEAEKVKAFEELEAQMDKKFGILMKDMHKQGADKIDNFDDRIEYEKLRADLDAEKRAKIEEIEKRLKDKFNQIAWAMLSKDLEESTDEDKTSLMQDLGGKGSEEQNLAEQVAEQNESDTETAGTSYDVIVDTANVDTANADTAVDAVADTNVAEPVKKATKPKTQVKIIPHTEVKNMNLDIFGFGFGRDDFDLDKFGPSVFNPEQVLTETFVGETKSEKAPKEKKTTRKKADTANKKADSDNKNADTDRKDSDVEKKKTDTAKHKKHDVVVTQKDYDNFNHMEETDFDLSLFDSFAMSADNNFDTLGENMAVLGMGIDALSRAKSKEPAIAENEKSKTSIENDQNPDIEDLTNAKDGHYNEEGKWVDSDGTVYNGFFDEDGRWIDFSYTNDKGEEIDNGYFDIKIGKWIPYGYFDEDGNYKLF